MPTYSYACTECGNRFDVVQAFTDDSLTTCDECSGRLRKLFSPVGVVFKGSGFYHNDSRESRKAPTNGSGHSKPDTSSGDKSGATEKSSATGDKSDKSDKSDKGGSSTNSTTATATSG